MKTTNVVGYARLRPREWLTLGGDIGYLRRPTLGDASGWFERDVQTTFALYPEDPAVSLAVQPNFMHGGLSITADTRNYRGHATTGGVYRAAWTTFRDQDAGAYTFHCYEAEAAHFVPLADERWVFAFHGWGVVSDVADDRDVPFYLMPSLGGANTIRAYSDYRFHDRNMIVVNAESRWALFSHVDLAAFFDAGNVAHRARDLNFDKTAYGIGIRLHTQRTTLGRLDFARGNGGWNVLFRTSDPFHLKRLSRRVAPVPFVP
jgi:outer membrane protein assembly factor BamA